MKNSFVAGIVLLIGTSLASAQVLNVDTSGNVTQAGNLTIEDPSTALLIDLSNSNCSGVNCGTANEFLQFGWDGTNSAFQITAKATGTGAIRNIEITPSGSSTNYTFVNTTGSFTNGKLTVGSSGIFTLYDNVTTAGIGAATVVGVTDIVNQTSNNSGNIVTSTSAAGHYEIRYYADVATPCTTGSTTWTFTFGWTDASATARSSPNIALTISTAQTSSAYISGVLPIYAASGSAISYTETHTPLCSSGTPKFDLHAEVVWTA
jgi:hypothetical protein